MCFIHRHIEQQKRLSLHCLLIFYVHADDEMNIENPLESLEVINGNNGSY